LGTATTLVCTPMGEMAAAAADMRAVVYERFGGPEVLEVQRVPKPEAGAGELLIAVHAAGVNPVDAQNRADGAWAELEPPVIPGYDFSGVIEVTDAGEWAEGDAVFGALPIRVTRRGSYAEYCVVDARRVARKPEGLAHVEAAAVPTAACTAHEALRRLELEPGEWLLIHGGGGGVGTFAVQLAASRGVRVLASASSAHHELLAELGAEACIDYAAEDVCAGARRIAGRDVDAIAAHLLHHVAENAERGHGLELVGSLCAAGKTEQDEQRQPDLHYEAILHGTNSFRWGIRLQASRCLRGTRR